MIPNHKQGNFRSLLYHLSTSVSVRVTYFSQSGLFTLPNIDHPNLPPQSENVWLSLSSIAHIYSPTKPWGFLLIYLLSFSLFFLTLPYFSVVFPPKIYRNTEKYGAQVTERRMWRLWFKWHLFNKAWLCSLNNHVRNLWKFTVKLNQICKWRWMGIWKHL